MEGATSDRPCPILLETSRRLNIGELIELDWRDESICGSHGYGFARCAAHLTPFPDLREEYSLSQLLM